MQFSRRTAVKSSNKPNTSLNVFPCGSGPIDVRGKVPDKGTVDDQWGSRGGAT